MKDFEQSMKDNGGISNQRQSTLQRYRMLEQKAFCGKVFAEFKMPCPIPSSSTIGKTRLLKSTAVFALVEVKQGR